MSDLYPEPDVWSERAILSCLWKYGTDAYVEIFDLINQDAFTVDTAQILFACMAHVLGNISITIPSLSKPMVWSAAQALKLDSFFRQMDQRDYIDAVIRMPVELHDARIAATKVAKLRVARELLQQLRVAEESLLKVTGDETVDEILRMAESPVMDLHAKLASFSQITGPVKLGEGAWEYFQQLLDTPRDCIGIPTGFSRYDRAIGGGLRAGGLDVIGARMKVGKSTLGANIAINIAGRLNIPVLNVDTEMDAGVQRTRAAATMAGLSYDDIECGRLTPSETERLKRVVDELAAMPYYYDSVQDLNIEDILSRIRRWVMRTVGLRDDGKAKPCVVIYDYFQLMRANEIGKNMAEHQALGFLVNSIKNMAGKLGISLLCFAQLNRNGEECEDSRAFANSDRILQKCSSAFIYKRKGAEKYLDGERPGDRKYTHKLIPVECRNGPGLEDEDYINIATDYAKSQALEGPTRIELFQSSKMQGVGNVAAGQVVVPGTEGNLLRKD
jgi:replicative DNA helicase